MIIAVIAFSPPHYKGASQDRRDKNECGKEGAESLNQYRTEIIQGEAVYKQVHPAGVDEAGGEQAVVFAVFAELFDAENAFFIGFGVGRQQ